MAGGEVVDRGRELARDQAGERHPVQDVADADAQRDPDLEQRLRRAGVLQGGRALVAHGDQRAVDRADDVGERDLVGGASQPVAAGAAADRDHDVAAAQVAQDPLEERDRQLLPDRQVVGAHRVAVRGRRQLGARAHRIVRLR